MSFKYIKKNLNICEKDPHTNEEKALNSCFQIDQSTSKIL